MPVEQVVGALFSCWSQENFFKYMSEEFNLDALAVRGLELQDPEARVVNPLWRALDRSVHRFQQRLGTLRNRIADLTRGAQSRQTAEAARRLQAQSDALDAEREVLKQKRRDTPRHITVAELDEQNALDVIRMIAYRAETRMMPVVAQARSAGGWRPGCGSAHSRRPSVLLRWQAAVACDEQFRPGGV